MSPKKSSSIVSVFYLVIAAVSVSLVGCGYFSGTGEEPVPEIDRALLEKKVDSRLLPLVEAHGQSPLSPEQMQQRGLLVSRHGVSVEIVVMQEQSVGMISEIILQAGGTVISSFEKSIYGYLPASAIGRLAAEEEVWAVRSAGIVAHPLRD